MQNAMFVKSGYATLAFPSGAKLTTTRLNRDRYVRINDGRNNPQLCAHGSTMGNTLIYSSDEQLARDCDATLYKTERGFEAAVERLRNLQPDWMAE